MARSWAHALCTLCRPITIPWLTELTAFPVPVQTPACYSGSEQVLRYSGASSEHLSPLIRAICIKTQMFLLCSQRISFELSELVRHWALLTTDCYEKGQLICLNGTGIMLNSHSKTGSLLSVSESYLVSIRDTFIDLRWNWKSSLAEISVPADPAVPWMW